MTPYSHHMNDSYLNAYTDELSKTLHSAHGNVGTMRTLRTAVARSIVRLGAWMLPEPPDLVDGRILVLDIRPTSNDDLPKAA